MLIRWGARLGVGCEEVVDYWITCATLRGCIADGSHIRTEKNVLQGKMVLGVSFVSIC